MAVHAPDGLAGAQGVGVWVRALDPPALQLPSCSSRAMRAERQAIFSMQQQQHIDRSRSSSSSSSSAVGAVAVSTQAAAAAAASTVAGAAAAAAHLLLRQLRQRSLPKVQWVVAARVQHLSCLHALA